MSLCLKPFLRCFIISLSSEQSETRQTFHTGFVEVDFEVFTAVCVKDSILWVVMKSSHVERCYCYLWGGGGYQENEFLWKTGTFPPDHVAFPILIFFLLSPYKIQSRHNKDVSNKNISVMPIYPYKYFV